jgi:hypothetical protein
MSGPRQTGDRRPAQETSRDAADPPRRSRRQHHPRPLHGRGAGRQLRAPRHPDGARGAGLDGLHQAAQARPDLAGVGRPRPLHLVLRPRVHVAVRAAAPHGLRPLARRHQAVPPVAQQDAGAPRAARHAGRGGHHRSARAGHRQRGRHGHGRAVPRGALQPAGAHAVRPQGVGHRVRRRPDGGRVGRGRLHGRALEAREDHRVLG